MTVAIATSLLLGIGGLTWELSRQAEPTPIPTWTQVSTRPAFVVSARFSPDGRSIAYSAGGNDGRMAIFSFREGEAFPRFTEQKGKVLALDRGGEIYFSCQGQMANNPGAGIPSSLLRWKGAGTSPRVWIENIQDCDLGPDGQRLAVIRYSNSELISGAPIDATLESPPGHILTQSKLWMACPRWSPDGKAIAYIQHTGNTWVGQIVVIDLAGHIRMKSRTMDSVQSLAWSPDGQAIVFTTEHGYNQRSRIAVMDMVGRTREILATGQNLVLMDIDPKGRMLISSSSGTFLSKLEQGGKFKDLDLPFEQDYGTAISSDGSKAAFVAIESDQTRWIYIRDQATNNLIRLTPGDSALGFSTDNEWLLVNRSQVAHDQALSVSLVPTGSGNEIPLNVQGLIRCFSGTLSDPDHPIVEAIQPNGIFGWFLLDPRHPPRQIAKDVEFSAFSNVVATNSGLLWGYDLKRGLVQGSIAEKPWTPIGGALANRVPLGWDPLTGDILVVGQQQYMGQDYGYQPKGPLNVERMNPITHQIRPDRVLDFRPLNSVNYKFAGQ
jgi:Tol biopolymer transport system component